MKQKPPTGEGDFSPGTMSPPPKQKKGIPVSATVFFERQPISFEEWQSKMKGIKLLYQNRQHRQCYKRCMELLQDSLVEIHPTHRVFLHFYAAISYETLGRGAHIYSSKRLPYLHQARDEATAAASALPNPDAVPYFDAHSDEDVESSSLKPEPRRTAPALTLHDKSNRTEHLPCKKSRHSKRLLQEKSSSDDAPLSPISLNIRKKVAFDPDSISSPPFNQFACPLPPIPTKSSKHHHHPSSPDFGKISTRNKVKSMMTRKEASISPTPLPRHGLLSSNPIPIPGPEPVPDHIIPHLNRYNAQLRSLHPQILALISNIDTLIDSTKAAQNARSLNQSKRFTSFWSFDPAALQNRANSVYKDEKAKETSEERIERLRENAWQDVGLRNKARGWKGSEYYQDLCDAALAECYD